jgi:hypothetical protein
VNRLPFLTTTRARRLARASLALALLPALALSVPGCAPQRRGGDARSAPGGFSVITADEIAARQWATVYDLVSTLRPQWFTPRGPDSLNGQPAPMQVYLDGTRLLGIGALQSMTPSGIVRIEYLTAVEASSRWGLDHGGGAILLTSRGR